VSYGIPFDGKTGYGKPLAKGKKKKKKKGVKKSSPRLSWRDRPVSSFHWGGGGGKKDIPMSETHFDWEKPGGAREIEYFRGRGGGGEKGKVPRNCARGEGVDRYLSLSKGGGKKRGKAPFCYRAKRGGVVRFLRPSGGKGGKEGAWKSLGTLNFDGKKHTLKSGGWAHGERKKKGITILLELFERGKKNRAHACPRPIRRGGGGGGNTVTREARSWLRERKALPGGEKKMARKDKRGEKGGGEKKTTFGQILWRGFTRCGKR